MSTTAFENENSTTTSIAITGYGVSPETIARRVERKQRQIRIFKVILLLMAVFFICRLPNWVYILYKMLEYDTQQNIHWVLNYSFGIMVLLNCMLNPFLYTFLSETIRLTTFLAGIICAIFRPIGRILSCHGCRSKNVEPPDVLNKSQTFDRM